MRIAVYICIIVCCEFSMSVPCCSETLPQNMPATTDRYGLSETSVDARSRARSLVKSGNLEAASAEFHKATRLDPTDADLMREFALVLLMTGHGDEATAKLQRAIELQPNYYEAYEDLGGIFYQTGQFGKAIDCISNSLKIKDTPQARLKRALAYQRNTQFGEAVSDCDVILASDPICIAARACRSFSNMRRGEFEEAERDAQFILSKNEDGGDYAHLILGVVALVNKDVEKAATEFALANEKRPNWPLPLILRALLRFQAHDMDRSLDDLDKAIATTKSPQELNYRLDGFGWQVYKMRGIINLLYKRDAAAGAKDFSQAIELNPKDPDSYALRSEAYVQSADWNRAVEDLNSSISLAPDHSVAIFYLVHVLTFSPDSKVRDGKRAVELAQQFCQRTDWKNCGALQALAAAYSESGDFKKAIEMQELAADQLRTPERQLTSPMKIWWNSQYVMTVKLRDSGVASLLQAYKEGKTYRLAAMQYTP